MERSLGFASIALVLSACGQISRQESASAVKALPNRWECISINDHGVSHGLNVMGFASNGLLIPSRVRFALLVGGHRVLYEAPRVVDSHDQNGNITNPTQPSHHANFEYKAQGNEVLFSVGASSVDWGVAYMIGSVRYVDGTVVPFDRVTCRAY